MRRCMTVTAEGIWTEEVAEMGQRFFQKMDFIMENQ